jgi:hypothetical protein
VAPRTATVEVDAIQAISLGRDERLYRWETVATGPLGLHSAASRSRNPSRRCSTITTSRIDGGPELGGGPRREPPIPHG